MTEYTSIVQPSATPVTVTIQIPDPIIVASGKTAVATQAAPIITQSGSTIPIPPDPPAVAKVYPMTRLGGDIPNCGKGMCTFGTPAFTYSPKSIYDRYSWYLMQTSATTLNTSYIKGLFDKAKVAKQTVNFRVGMFDSGGGWGSTSINGVACYYPVFVHNIMQAESVKDWNNGKVWFPNWNSPGMLKAWADFLKLLAKWCKDNGYYQMLDFVDIGGYGDFESEWHMYGFDDVEKQHGTKITAASQQSFVDASMQAFPDIPNIGNQAMLDNRYATPDFSYYACTVKNQYGLMGFRNDHLGWTDVIEADKKRMDVNYNGVNFLQQYNTRYKSAPMIGEPMNSVSAVTPPGGTPYQTLPNNVVDFGMCQFENVASSTTAQAQTNYMNACNLTGQTGIDTVTIDEKGVATIQQFNTQKAGLYWPWKTTFIADGVTLKDSNIPIGTKTLSVLLSDPTGYREPFFLANTGRGKDGSYKVF